jgi:hypothetical protein
MISMFSAAIAITAGLLILLGYFLPIDPLRSLKDVLVQWSMILAAFALLVGVVNLIKVHLARVQSRKISGLYSLILIISFSLTVVIAGYFGPTASPSMWIFNYIQMPIETSLLAILAVTLAYAGARLLSRRPNGFTILFILIVIFVLLGTTPLIFFGEVRFLSILRNLIIQVPAVAGARGILLGVALGAIATGIRILLGSDRPYGG